MDNEIPIHDTQELMTHAGRLQAIARRLSGNWQTAEDIVQDSWVAALEADIAHGGRAGCNGGWRAWLVGVARNLSLKRVRRDAQRHAIEREAARSEAFDAGEALASRMHMQRQLADAILGLREPHRQALVMRYLDDASYEDIARTQQTSDSNARQRVSRALSTLRLRLGASGAPTRGPLPAWLAIFRPKENWLPAGTGIGQTTTGPLTIGVALMGMKTIVGIVATVGSIALLATLMEGDSEREASGIVPDTKGDVVQQGPQEELRSEPNPELARAPLQASTRTSVGVLASPLTGSTRVLRGRVTDSSALPLKGVAVRSRSYSMMDVWLQAGASTEDEEAVTTDDKGQYELDPLDGESVSFELDGYLPSARTLPELGNLDVSLLRRPRLMGQVRRESGEAIEPPGKVKVWVVTQGGKTPSEYETETTVGGHFEFDNLPAGRAVRMWSRAKGFDEAEESIALELVAEQTFLRDIELPRGLSIVGVVRDAETKKPVPFAKVWSRNFRYEEDSVMPGAIADDQGRYRIEGLKREDTQFGPRTMCVVLLSGSAPTHVSSPFSPSWVMPDEEGVCQHDLELVPSSCSLQVVLLHPGGEEPARGVFVWHVDSQKNFGHQRSNEEGRLNFEGLPSGKLGIAAYTLGRGPTGEYESLFVELDLTSSSHDLLELELRSDPTTSISGRIVGLDGLPVVDSDVVLHYDLLSNGVQMPLDHDATRTDMEGRYRFESIRAGNYRVQTTSCTDPIEQQFELAGGERREGVDFVRGTCMTISGRIDAGDSVRSTLAVRLVRPPSNDGIRHASIEANGAFRIEDVLEGAYEVVLLIDNEAVDRAPVNVRACTSIWLRVP